MTMINPGPFRLVELIVDQAASEDIISGTSFMIRLWGEPFHFVSLDGIGMAPIRRLTDRLPMHHGQVDRGYRLDERHMLLTLYAEAKDEVHAAGLRDRLAYGLMSLTHPIRIRVTRDDGTVRQISCFLDGEMDFIQSERVSQTGFKILVPLLAPNPTWTGPTRNMVNLQLTNGTMVIPIDVTGTTFESWPTLEFTGPFDAGLTFSSELSSHTFSWTTAATTDMNVGRRHVSLLPNFKTAMTGTTNPSLATGIWTASDISAYREFRIPSHKEVKLALGDPNATSFDYTLSDIAGTNSDSRIKIIWLKRYLSL